MASNSDRDGNGNKPPAQDEWGLYDPEKAGLSALFHRLDESPGQEEHDSGVRTRVLNMSGVRKPQNPQSSGGRNIL
jgi:hypothetical protein